MVVVTSTESTQMPKVRLSEYLKKIENKEITPEVLPFEASLRFFNLSDFDSLTDLENLLSEYSSRCYIEKLLDRNVVVHFWEKNYAEGAMKKLKKSFTSFANVSLEENEKLKSETEQADHIKEDILIQGVEPVDNGSEAQEEENKTLDNPAEFRQVKSNSKTEGAEFKAEELPAGLVLRARRTCSRGLADVVGAKVFS